MEGAIQNDTILMMMIGDGIDPCVDDTSYMELVVIPGAYAQAGSDENTCFGVPYDFANSTDSSFATNYVTLYWLTSGTGSFINGNTTKPIYVPGPNEIGQVTLSMVASNVIACDSIDEMILTIRPTYEIPVDMTVCHYDSAFLQGAWQYVSGTYFDTLYTANYGCDSVTVTTLTVRDKIDRDFVISSGDSICNGETVSFTSVGTANLVDWLWDFGDGTTSDDFDPTQQIKYPTRIFFSSKALRKAFRFGSLESIKYLHKIGTPFPDFIRAGESPASRYFWADFVDLVKGGYFDCVKYVMEETGFTFPLKMTHNTKLLFNEYTDTKDENIKKILNYIKTQSELYHVRNNFT